MIPFLVADRPISLSIIKGIALPEGAKVGIMGRAAGTTARFKELFARYPYSVDVIYANKEPDDATIARQTVKMVDCGMFAKGGCTLEYEDLFAQYEAMRADYGIMIDVLRDTDATIASAERAMAEYERCQRSFDLVGVAQGRNVKQYLQCYEELLKLGYTHIAIGGLLQRRENTSRYVYVRGGGLLEKVLAAVRKNFDPEWLFVLGAYNPSRAPLLREYGVWGSDYKGWIFNYEKKAPLLQQIRSGKIASNARISRRNLRVRDVRSLGEQRLRFSLVRWFLEDRVISAEHQSTEAPAARNRRLLILPCSQRKRRTKRRIPAWELYDGGVYRVTKRLQREGRFPADVDVMIVSAKHGLILPEHHIGWYDQKMTTAVALRQAIRNVQQLRNRCAGGTYGEVFLCLGKVYRQAVAPTKFWAPPTMTVRCARGRIGEQLRQLRLWLETRTLAKGKCASRSA